MANNPRAAKREMARYWSRLSRLESELRKNGVEITPEIRGMINEWADNRFVDDEARFQSIICAGLAPAVPGKE
jgi:hypothetical protein